MQFTFGTIVGLIIIVLICLSNLKSACFIAICTTVFPLLSFVNIQGNSIYVYHIAILFLLFKLLRKDKLKVHYNIPKEITIFIIYCGISIFFPLFVTDCYVINVDNQFSKVTFSFQQFTQYLYLLFSVLTLAIAYRLLRKKTILIKDVYKLMLILYNIVLLFGLLQIIIPENIYNYLFRNGVNEPVHQYNSFGMVRISSTFSESSFLMLFLTPIICILTWTFLTRKKNLFLFFDILIGIVIGFETQSSSFLVGIALFALILIIYFIHSILKDFKIKKKNIINLLLIILIPVLVFMLKDQISMSIQSLNIKLSDFNNINITSSGNISGYQRGQAFNLHMQAFLKYPFLGVGFGTVRSYDLFSEWLAELGVIGFAVYLCYLIKTEVKIFKIKKYNLFIYILVYNFILMTAVPEFNYVYIWIAYAISYFLINNKGIEHD